MWVWSCERMHVCPHVNTRDRDWWWAVIINMFLKALHPIHVPLAPCNEAHCFESIHQSHSVERCWKWTDAALPRWPNSPHAGGGRARSIHFYTSIYLMKWPAQTALDEHLLLSLCESIEQRVNLRGVVFSPIKTFALWWQTDLFQALLKQHWQACCPPGLFSLCMDLCNVSRPHKSWGGPLRAIQTKTIAGV